MASKQESGNRIVSLSLPTSILKEIDSAVEEVGYTSRSELVRDAVRAFLRGKAEVSNLDGHIDGIMLLVYDHECAARVSEVRHNHMSVFKSFMHADFDGGDDCCEVLMFCGDAAEIKDAYNRLSSLVGVKEARIFLA